MKHLKKLAFLLILIAIICNFEVKAQSFPAVFADNMVLQQNSEVPIWGWADASQEIRIKVSWDTTTYKVKAANNTRWNTKLKTPKAGGPHTITIYGTEEKTIKNVMVGEVWLCSGQSNMEWSARNVFNNWEEEVKNANFPNIRLFQIQKMSSKYPQENCIASWKECTPENMKGFSAVAYFFARRLQDSLKVPIGLIQAAWGGTSAENWLPAKNILNDAELLKYSKEQKDWPWCPATIGEVYNSMIAPLVPYKMAGAIWYQGESNCGTYKGYTKLMNTLIKSWREEFQTDLAFYYVQIAPHTYGDATNNSAYLREAQANTLQVPNTGMVVISDLVENIKDIHPRNKQDVGKRLGDMALVRTYKKSSLNCSYPTYKSMKIEKEKIRILFNNAPNGLISKNGEPSSFEIAGADQKFFAATAKIENNSIIVSSKDVKTPVSVRFSFKNDAIGNVFSKEGLPLQPFRTDNW